MLREFEQQAPVYGSDWDAAPHNGALSNESVDNVCPFLSHYAFNFSFHKHTLFFKKQKSYLENHECYKVSMENWIGPRDNVFS